jgi:endonuclease G
MAREKSQTVTIDTLPKELRVPTSVLDRIKSLQPTLETAAACIVQGKRPAENPDRERMIEARRAMGRIQTIAGTEAPTLERLIGSDDLLPISFFSRGLLAARSVARISLAGGSWFGTGFLVGPRMLMTAHHVIATPAMAAGAEVAFELFDAEGRVVDVRHPKLDPERFFFTDEKLDVTVVALRTPATDRENTDDLGWHPMIGQEGKIRIGDPVNIIQHPSGRSKTVVVHNSNLLHLENGGDRDPFLWYSSDTERGSSGAPVFNSNWEVVGVHHRSVPSTNERGELIDANGLTIDRERFKANPDIAVWIANEGTRTSRIVAALQHATLEGDQAKQARDVLLALWEASRLYNQGQEAAARGYRRSVMLSGIGSVIEGGQGSKDNLVRAHGVSVQITIVPERRT